MKTSAPARSRKGSESDPACQAEIAALQDRLLLYLRDGLRKTVAELAEWLAPRVNPDLVIQRYLDAGGIHDKKLEHKASEGQRLVLKDVLDGLKQRQLLAFRQTGKGEEEVRVAPQRDSRFTIDPEFENLLPRAPDEVLKLEERLLVEAPRDPLVVWKEKRLLVDGHTRYKIFSLLGRQYEVVEMEFADRAAVMAWMYASHYGRRSYSAEMKSYVRGKEYLGRKQKHGGPRQKARGQSAPRKTAEVMAAEYHIDPKTIKRDAVFALALDRVADACGDAVRQQVLSRQLKWTKRDVERLAKLEQAKLQGIVRAALEDEKRPKVPVVVKTKKPAGGGDPVNLPPDKPGEQVRILRKVLGGRRLERLYEALSQWYQRRKKAD